jgi:hypothetical protein
MRTEGPSNPRRKATTQLFVVMVTSMPLCWTEKFLLSTIVTFQVEASECFSLLNVYISIIRFPEQHGVWYMVVKGNITPKSFSSHEIERSSKSA